jgi:adenylosuccinate synthase
MPLRVMVGGFFGDEGKGKIFGYLARKDNYDGTLKTGGPQAGHSSWIWKTKYVFKQLPTAVLNKRTKLLLPVGAMIDPIVLLKEVAQYGKFEVDGRLYIDEMATIINPEHVDREKEGTVKSIGSVGTGVGTAYADRVQRKGDLTLARDVPELRKYSMGVNVSKMVNAMLDEGKEVAIEGSHGTFLSNLHGTYPFTNAYDNIASALLDQVGIGPFRVDSIYLILKSYVTRVGKGPLPGELSKEEGERRGWAEKASVSLRDRRTAPFNVELARKSIELNSPTEIALTKVDMLFPEAAGITEFDDLPQACRTWVNNLEKQLGGKVPITLIGTGKDIKHVIDLRAEKKPYRWQNAG